MKYICSIVVMSILLIGTSCEKKEISGNIVEENTNYRNQQQQITFKMFDDQNNILANQSFSLYDVNQQQPIANPTSNSSGCINLTLSNGTYFFKTQLNGVEAGTENFLVNYTNEDSLGSDFPFELFVW